MMRLRAAHIKDLDAMHQMAESSSLGVTNLPKDRALLKERLKTTEESFAKPVFEPKHEIYTFVLEDLTEKTLVGTSTLIGSSPLFYPAPYFKKSPHIQKGLKIPHVAKYKTMELYFDTSFPSELCGLYLNPKVRHTFAGRLLSLGRLLYIADHPTRFQPELFADLRGTISDDGLCPFWDSIVHHFCPVSFKEAIDIYIHDPIEFAKILPKNAIYVSLLPYKTQEVLGKPHERSIPALKMLEGEGFTLTNDIHPLDGGPRLLAHMSSVRSIQESQIAKVTQFLEMKGQESHLIARTSPPFYATAGELMEIKNGEIAVSTEVERALELNSGDTVRLVRIRP